MKSRRVYSSDWEGAGGDSGGKVHRDEEAEYRAGEGVDVTGENERGHTVFSFL